MMQQLIMALTISTIINWYLMQLHKVVELLTYTILASVSLVQLVVVY